jgi:glycosyltransferase involved in cell wall biosynthesis
MSSPRVLLLTTYYHPVLGGVETNVRRLAAFLARAGFDVRIITKRVYADSPRDERIDDVPVHRLPPVGDRSPAGKWLMLPFAFAALLRRRREYDLICCVDYRGIGVAAIMAGRLLRRPVVVQAGTTGVLSCSNWDDADARRGLGPVGLVGRLARRPLRTIYGAASAYLCISREIEEEALTCGVPRARIHYLPHSIDTGEFHPPQDQERARIRSEEGWPADRLNVLFVGRLSREKGVLDLMEAWRLLDRPDAHLVIVGPDMPAHPWDAGPRVRELIAQHGLADRVRVLGPRADVARLLRGADLFVQPSHFEAFGISVIEAMATGLPIVATAVGGMLDYLVDRDNALLAPAQDPAALADRIGEALNGAALRQHLGTRARATVEALFDEAVVFGRTADLLRTLAARPA